MPTEVMSPELAAAAWPNALSFTRLFVSSMLRGGWRVERVHLRLDATGRGDALYRLFADEMIFHFLVVSFAVDSGDKTDRAFGVNWDVCAALCSGDWSPEREDRLRKQIPAQLAGRFDSETLCFVRGNRSERLFDHVVDSLARGDQPDAKFVSSVGYLLRTTGFIGNGVAGTQPFLSMERDAPLSRPYYAQMCAAFLLREFVFELADHMAASVNPAAAKLHPELKRYLGIGNSAGLGMVPFAARRIPVIHQWVHVREAAFAEAISRPMHRQGAKMTELTRLVSDARSYFAHDDRDGNGIYTPHEVILKDLATVERLLAEYGSSGTLDQRQVGADAFWKELLAAISHLNAETRELVISLSLEGEPDIVDAFADQLWGDANSGIVPERTIGDLSQMIRESWGWAFADFRTDSEASRCFWYLPHESQYEYRRGVRGRLPSIEVETEMDAPLSAFRLLERLQQLPETMTVSDLVASLPESRAVVEMTEMAVRYPYGYVRENTLHSAFLPFAISRLVLSFFGMEKLDPRPPISVKGALLQGAPLAADLESGVVSQKRFALLSEDFLQSPAQVLHVRAFREEDRLDEATASELVARYDIKDCDQPATEIAIVPSELEKATHRILAAQGVPLNIGWGAGKMVAWAECAGLGGIRALLRSENHNLPRPIPPVSFRPLSSGIHAAVSSGQSLFILGPSALDAALSLARDRSHPCGAVLLDGCVGYGLLTRLAHGARERGFAGLAAWYEDGQHTCVLADPRTDTFDLIVGGDPVELFAGVPSDERHYGPGNRYAVICAVLPEQLSVFGDLRNGRAVRDIRHIRRMKELVAPVSDFNRIKSLADKSYVTRDDETKLA
ncbi:MAG: hypothetical protein KDJ90_17675 [Nitratireductor sp.]|nr:hypothetical protein [Nitratireductor sp.]